MIILKVKVITMDKKHIYENMEDNFIDGCYPKNKNIKGDLSYGEIKFHTGISHMNSSQAMCINYFKKFFEKPEYENYLLNILADIGVEIIQTDTISSATFEYRPNTKDNTSYDFYIVLTSGKRIYFDIKYAESRFGCIKSCKKDPGRYKRCWKMFYQNMVRGCFWLSLSKRAFYNNYQINRNILYAAPNDYVLFITPRVNDSKGIVDGRKYIDDFKNDHIKNIYWEDLMETTIETVARCDELKEYYDKFFDKYMRV